MTLKVGLIMYSVRNEMAKDPLETVEKVGELGYKFVETCNHRAGSDPGCGFNVPAEEIKTRFDRFGTKVISTHIFPIESADMDKVVEYNHIIGNDTLVNPMGSFDTYDHLMEYCEHMNAIGKRLREDGIQYLYHNHQFEYRTFKGKTILDYLYENTDPEYVGFELDTYWTMRGGRCPLEILQKFGKRIKLIHQKDFPWDAIEQINLNGLTPEELEMKPGEAVGLNANSAYAKNGGHHVEPTDEEQREFRRRRETSFTEIGSGIMDIQAIIDTANAYTDAKYIILEQDYTRMPTQFDSIKKSMEGFHKFSGIEWE